MTVTVDPLYWHVARWLLAGVFVAGLAHKLRSPKNFIVVVRDYRIVPAGLAPFVAAMIMSLEGLVLVGLISGTGLRTSALLAAGLLAVYWLAMAFNLARGRNDIDCGCFGPAAGRASARQRLSGWLLARNAVLIGVAGLVLAPVSGRELIWLDMAGVVPGVIAATMIYFAADQLIANRSLVDDLVQ